MKPLRVEVVREDILRSKLDLGNGPEGEKEAPKQGRVGTYTSHWILATVFPGS